MSYDFYLSSFGSGQSPEAPTDNTTPALAYG